MVGGKLFECGTLRQEGLETGIQLSGNIIVYILRIVCNTIVRRYAYLILGADCNYPYRSTLQLRLQC